MSRYLLLFLINLPFIFLALLSSLTQYKLKKASLKKTVLKFIIWFFVLIGLALAEPIYIWLYKNQLTETEPLSLFDVVQITSIVMLYYLYNSSRTKIDNIEKKLNDLHQELSIMLSKR